MTEENTDTGTAEARQFSLGKLYLKDVSLEAPNCPEAFLNENEWDPKVNLQYSIEHRDLSEGRYDVVLTLTVTANDGERTLFLLEIKQGGVFLVHGDPKPKPLERLLNVRCPRLLFPYAREAVDNLIVKAGFPALMLAPIDFKEAYQRQLAGTTNA
jgi:preprotein translocase subunit SecB